MISFLYDVAGRSEDAVFLTWERIEEQSVGGAVVKMAMGKTSKLRNNVITPMTMNLINELKLLTGNSVGEVFRFKSAANLRKWLHRLIVKLTLPKESSIKVSNW